MKQILVFILVGPSVLLSLKLDKLSKEGKKGNQKDLQFIKEEQKNINQHNDNLFTQPPKGSELDENKVWQLSEETAKIYLRSGKHGELRRKRSSILGFMEEMAEIAEGVEEVAEFSCRATCWGKWGGWSSCDRECGKFGTRTRERTEVKECEDGCPGASSMSWSCNRFCYNGGTIRSFVLLHFLQYYLLYYTQCHYIYFSLSWFTKNSYILTGSQVPVYMKPCTSHLRFQTLVDTA